MMIPGIRTLILLAAVASAVAWAQETPAPTPDQGSQSQQPASQEPVAPYGQEGQVPAVTENPPISGLDLPSLEPHAAPLSYIQPGATLSQSIDTNPFTSLGGQSVTSVSRGLGSVTLQRVWSHYDLAADYMGGVAYYDVHGQGFKALQQADVQQKVSWKRGELNLRDSFSYLPEGNFGAAYGSMGSQAISSLGTTAFSSFFGGTTLGSIGLVPRITNVALADMSEYLSPKGAITLTGGYGLTHFYGNLAPTLSEPNGVQTSAYLIGNSQLSTQAGYSRVLSAQTQVALMYGYQAFDFSAAATSFHSNIIQLMYGHRISGRLDFLIAAGPQFTRLDLGCTSIAEALAESQYCSVTSQGQVTGTIPDTRIGAAGRVRLRYRLSKTTLQASYERFETPGSGLFAGAQTDVAILSANRPLTRVWSVSADLGYSRNVRLQPSTEGVNAQSYTYGFVGGVLHRQFGHSFHGFISYQFNELAFDSTFCQGVAGCNRISNRQVATFGLDWTPRPMRLD